MFGKLPRVVFLGSAGSFLALFVCAVSLPGHAMAADLRLRINPKNEQHDPISQQEKREQLFERFLHWLRSHQVGLKSPNERG
ncbi:MAG TPA: hypothetical protein VMU69_18045 [Bradyrhizobium sp.]|nr:hypothetical protein [Bradyrhizobium sp.]